MSAAGKGSKQTEKWLRWQFVCYWKYRKLWKIVLTVCNYVLRIRLSFYLRLSVNRLFYKITVNCYLFVLNRLLNLPDIFKLPKLLDCAQTGLQSVCREPVFAPIKKNAQFSCFWLSHCLPKSFKICKTFSSKKKNKMAMFCSYMVTCDERSSEDGVFRQNMVWLFPGLFLLIVWLFSVKTMWQPWKS